MEERLGYQGRCQALRDRAPRLGFGNRTVFAAQQQFEGSAYLVAGVEPGNVVGAPVVDPADIDDQLSKYILPGQPRWSPAYVTVDGKPILILTIEAPRAGDPIFALQKGYDVAPAGRVYVRRHGKTEEAGPADLRALEARGQAARPKVELLVTRAAETNVLRGASFTKEDLAQWLAREQQRLAIPPDPPRRPYDYITSFPASERFLSSETRSKDRYTQEVGAYLARAHRRWLALVAIATVRDELAPIDLQIVNPTDRNFEGVEVVVELPDKLMVWMSTDDVEATLKAPSPPKLWGTHRITDIFPDVAPRVRVRNDEVEREGDSRRVRFLARHVRPGETVRLPLIYLTLPAEMAGQELDIRWRLTSTGVDGWREGEITFAVAQETVDVDAANE